MDENMNPETDQPMEPSEPEAAPMMPEAPVAPPPPPAPAPMAPPPPPQPGYAPPAAPAVGSTDKSKVVAGILAILLGALGVHKFYLGYNKEGAIMLGVSVLLSWTGIGPAAMSVVGLIEGIMYLTKSDEEFVSTYVTGRKAWF
jgi:TM2 domain-containing membrane protein YozV